MEWESDSPCCSHTYLGQGYRSPRKYSSWELEFRDCGAIPGRGCCWLRRDRLSGCEGGYCGGKCLWRKARQPWKQGDTAESHVGGVAITIALLSPHTSNESSTVERLAHQAPNALNYRVGRHSGSPFKCLMRPSTEQDCSREALYVPERAELRRKTGQRVPLSTSYRRLDKRLRGP